MAAALREKEGLIAKLEAEAEALRATMRRWVRQRWRGMAWPPGVRAPSAWHSAERC